MDTVSITPFKVRVIEPCLTVEKGGMPAGTVTTARAVVVEPALSGQVQLYFLAWNPTRKRYMLEPAWQFEEVNE